MVGHIPLEDGIGVRVPDRQQKRGAFFAAGRKPTAWLSSGTRRPFPCECTHERKRYTESVRFEKCTHNP